MNEEIYTKGGKYSGQYVATESFSSPKVICYGKDAILVRKKAKGKCKNPIVFYVPTEKTVHIY